ncbi:hypothetical protein BH10BAC2_BH10BAC2_13800 [soil metagenome]
MALCASGQTNSNENNFWESGLNNSTGLLKMIKLRPINIDSLNYKSIISFLNGGNSKSTDNNYIVFKKISEDTLYIKINNTTSLTQRIGTAGAMLYLAKVTYNFTELKGITYVNMDFEEGDHASPGIFSRKSFYNK